MRSSDSARHGGGGRNRPLVCLVETREDGHHPMYASVYAQALLDLGCDVLLVAPAPLLDVMPPVALRSGSGAFDRPCGRLTRVPWDLPLRPTEGGTRCEVVAARLWESLAGLLDRGLGVGRYPDLLLHLYFDDFLAEVLPRRFVDARIRCPFAGLLFKPPSRIPRSLRDAAKRLVRMGRRYTVLRSRRCAAVLLLDATESLHLQSRGKPPTVEVPEVSFAGLPEAEPEIIADIRRRASGRSICSLVGSIDERKGLLPFVRAAEAAPPDEWLFVVAGRMEWQWISRECKEIIARLTDGPRPRVVVVDQWLDDDVLNATIAASDLLHVYYPNWQYSTNMFCKTATYGVPAVGGTVGYTGRMMRDYHLGMTVSSDAEYAAIFVPGAAARVSTLAASVRFREGCRRYREANNTTVLCRTLAGVLGAAGVTHSEPCDEFDTSPSAEAPGHGG